MSAPDKVQLIFERWKASLRDKNRSKEFVVSNFDELFDALLQAGATFDEAYALVPAAVKAHQPPPSTVRHFWRTSKNKADTTEKEFAEEWNKDIADKCTNSFYNSFPIPKDLEDKEPKVYGDGKISEKEYRLLRDHADKFRPLDLSTLPDPTEELMSEEEILEFIKGQAK